MSAKTEVKILPEQIAEIATDMVKANHYYIKIAVPMWYQQRLKELAARLGFKRAPVAMAARVIALLGALHHDQVEAWFIAMNEETAKLVERSSLWEGCDPSLN
jgi:hypothetical protein